MKYNTTENIPYFTSISVNLKEKRTVLYRKVFPGYPTKCPNDILKNQTLYTVKMYVNSTIKVSKFIKRIQLLLGEFFLDF